MADAMQLVISDKRWSSWSMRPWLALKRTGAPFGEVLVRLRRDTSAAAIAQAGSPTGRVPILKDGDLVVWDSLAICEHLAERFAQAQLWPADPGARTLARCAAAEMHSGFPAVRQALPMDLGLRTTAPLSEEVAAELRRLVSLWCDLRGRFGGDGPFLTGRWSIADAMFAPMATRLRSYGVDPAALGDHAGLARGYAETLLADPGYLQWEREALAET